ncbi:MAG: hypothetical protein LLF81_08620 [Porphyromonadaceae bacterium]|nr:hypothetical protein [Porphyromonadaceae bacterium]
MGKTNFLLMIFLLICSNNFAQQKAFNVNNIQLQELQRLNERKIIRVPDILNYKTLKCDFHMHTVFSDGSVWPTVRVEEAWREGLDAIAITDHIERQPSKEHIGGDKNSSYEIAEKLAKELEIILIRAGEVTRSMPPGHLNTIFLKDVNILVQDEPINALKAAKENGAFIMWNHPGWKAQQPDTCLWMDMHQELYEQGLINGIEVFNEKEWYPIALDWCLEKDLAPIANSDIHGVAEYYYDYSKFFRPMTLVFAEDNTQQSIKEALDNARSVAFFANILAGKEEYLKEIFLQSVKIRKLGSFRDAERYEITNNSDIPFIMEGITSLELKPNSSALFIVEEKDKNDYMMIKNLITGSTKCLEISFSELW